MEEKTTVRGEAWRTWLCSFFLPCILMVTVYAAIGIFPFGEKSLLIIDMNNEYIDYLAQMNESVRTGGSLLRTWNMGMGLNMLGLIAFYTSSPFNLLVMLFPVEWITEVIFAVTVLKIGLAGLLFAVYTSYTFGRRGLFAVVFSVAYALSAYLIAYASNLMWLDGAAFLPLVLLGVERLIREQKWGMLCFAYAYVFLTSYYIGYMIGVFSVLYLVTIWFSQRRERPLRLFWDKFAGLLGAAVLAAGCCAFLLLPAFLGLKDGQNNMWTVSATPALQKSAVRILSRMLPGMYDTLTDPGYPNIYCTVLGLLLCMAFFCHRRIPRREKLVQGALLAFLLVSFSSELIDLAWHAFEDPTWFPARYSFVFSFWVLYLAMRAALDRKGLTAAGMLGAAGLVGFLIVEVAIGRFRYQSGWALLAAALLVLLYVLAWWLRKRGRGTRWIAAAVLLLVCAETWWNAFVMQRQLDEQFQYRDRQGYTVFRETYGPAVEQVAAEDSGVYRLEIVEQRNANGGMALGFNGISHYSTTTDQALNAFLRDLGYNKGTENELRFSPNTPLTNGLLGIKYVLSRSDLGPGYRKQADVGDVGVYKNLCTFPLAFWSGEQAESANSGGWGSDPFAIQNDLVDALGGGTCFIPVADVELLLHNVDREEKEGYWLYTRRVEKEPAVIEYLLHNPTGRETFAYFPVWQAKFSGAKVLVDGAVVQEDLRYRQNTVIALGSGESVSIALELDGAQARLAGEYFYTLDLEVAQAVSAQAGEHAVRFDVFRDTEVRGTVSAPEEGFLVTTFPSDRGWRVCLDGKEVEPKTFAGVFLAVPIALGEHRLDMQYRPPGFAVGCAISIVCLLAIACLGLRKRYGS